MKMGIQLLLAFAFAAPPAAAQSQSQPAQSTPIVVQGQQDKEKRVVCEMETPTGSLFGKKVCRTVAAIDQNHQQSVKFMDEGSRIQTLNTLTCQARNSC
jgi:hypothetical protein